MTISDTTEAIPVYDKESDLQVGEYMVSNQKAEVKFLQDIKGVISAFSAEMELEVRFKEEILTEEQQKYRWKIQMYEDGTYQEVVLNLPEMVTVQKQEITETLILEPDLLSKSDSGDGSDSEPSVFLEAPGNRENNSFTDEKTGFNFAVTERHSEEIRERFSGLIIITAEENVLLQVKCL